MPSTAFDRYDEFRRMLEDGFCVRSEYGEQFLYSRSARIDEFSYAFIDFRATQELCSGSRAHTIAGAQFRPRYVVGLRIEPTIRFPPVRNLRLLYQSLVPSLALQ